MLFNLTVSVTYPLIKPVCPKGMQVFPGQVGLGKNTVCVRLRMSAVNIIQVRLYSFILFSSDL